MNPDYIEEVVKFPYTLDDFQKKSADAILADEHVLVTAHTSAGKSTVAEFSIGLARKKNQRSIYTSPIKALSNQKYGDFQKKYTGQTSVGIMTGDIKVNPDADILVATTEIVNNLLYNNLEYFDNVHSVILDEVHYIRDPERGHVWEEVIAMMPKHVILVLLSASIPGAEGFARWVQDIKGKKCHLISTAYRPVPLVHQAYWNGECKTVIKPNGEVDAQVYKSVYNSWKEQMNGRPKDRDSQSTVLTKFLEHIEERELFPALFFNFSRKQCEKLAKMIQRSWLDGKEQTECINLFEFYVKKYLGESGMQLQQVWMIRSLLAKGTCIHHSGLIPILKEIIEVIFDKGWIKVMFVTETFAVGINMPTKCVVFGELQKFDGKEQRCLNPEEYCQMAGRAGRRGKDTLGTVIYFPCPPKNMVTLGEFANVVKGKHSSIISRFKMDPVLLLRCIDNERPPEELFETTLMNQEIKDSLSGIQFEINSAADKMDGIDITESEMTDYLSLKKLTATMKAAKPKQRKRLQCQVTEAKKALGEQTIGKIHARQELQVELKKLEQNKKDAQNYIAETCKWQTQVLLNTGYLTRADETGTGTVTTTLLGRACTGMNESDSFLSVEYLKGLFERHPTIPGSMASCLAFVIGTLVDEKECNKDGGADCDMNSLYTDLLPSVADIGLITTETEALKTKYSQLATEERLRDYSAELTPLFGAFVYLWTIEGTSYNDIMQRLQIPIYEGNFVRDMLKVHNICEEWKTVAEIYQRPDFVGCLEEIQRKIVRDIVICDSLYIQS